MKRQPVHAMGGMSRIEGLLRRGDPIGRREFLKRAAVAGAGLIILSSPWRGLAATAAPLATRVLGRTKEKVTVLGLGTAPAGEGPVPVDEGAKIFGEILDRGVTYVDTARVYNKAEDMLGQVLPSRRDKLFLVTKVSVNTADEAERSLADSMRRLKTDHLDLVHIHNIGDRNLDVVLGKGGVLEFLQKQKEAGKTRFIGVTGHSRPSNFLRMFQTGQIDVMMTVLNYADRNNYDFESKVLPEARKRNIGVIAMKAYVGIKGGFPNHRNGAVGCVTEPARLPAALAYALDLEGVTAAVVGPFTVEQGVQNVEFATKYKPLAEADRAALLEYGKKIAPTLGTRYGPNT